MPEKESKSASAFQQAGWTVHGSVYNVGGDLILSKESSKEDFLKVLDSLKSDIRNLSELSKEDSKVIESALGVVAREARQPDPKGPVVVGGLRTLDKVLRDLTRTGRH